MWKKLTCCFGCVDGTSISANNEDIPSIPSSKNQVPSVSVSPPLSPRNIPLAVNNDVYGQPFLQNLTPSSSPSDQSHWQSPRLGVDLHNTSLAQSLPVTPSRSVHSSYSHRDLYAQETVSAGTPSSFFGAHDFQMNRPQFISAAEAHFSNNMHGLSPQQILHQNIASSALHNSNERFDAPKCDPETRIALLEELMEWIEDRSRPSGILCMTGSAGLGKSALQQSIAEKCSEKGILAAAFFFAAADPLRNNILRFAPTLVYQLAKSIESIRPFVYRAIEENPEIFELSLQAQFQTLVVQPLQLAGLGSFQAHGPEFPYAILIDGLDECKNEGHQTEFLRVLYTCILANCLPFKLFLCSRPEYPIRSALGKSGSLKGIAHHIVLNDYDATSDIRGHICRNLRAIGRASDDPQISDSVWPSDNEIEALVEHANGQFIYAATVVKFIKEPRRSPFDRLQDVLTWAPGVQQPEKPFAALDALYTHILLRAQSNLKHSKDDIGIVRLLRKIEYHDAVTSARLTGIMKSGVGQYTFHPTVLEVEKFFQLQPSAILYMLCDVHSVVDVAPAKLRSSEASTIKPYHKSFTDFLHDPKRSGRFHIPDREIYIELAVYAMEILINSSQSDLRAALKLPQRTCGTAVGLGLSKWILFLYASLPDAGEEVDDRLFNTLTKLSTSGTWGKLSQVVRATQPRTDCDGSWTVRPNLGTIPSWATELEQFVNEFSRKKLKGRDRWQIHFDSMKAYSDLITAKTW